jgi:hypothetical protein
MEWAAQASAGLGLALVSCLPLIAMRYQEYQLAKIGLDLPEHVTVDELNRYMRRLFRAMGYRIEAPPAEGFPFDLILIDSLNQRRGVLLHQWQHRLTKPTLQALLAEAERVHLLPPIILTIGGAAVGTSRLADKAGAEIWTLKQIRDAVKRVHEVVLVPVVRPLLTPETALEILVSGDPLPVRPQYRSVLKAINPWRNVDPPRCPRCGKKMLMRKDARREYWSCMTFPRCLGVLSAE